MCGIVGIVDTKKQTRSTDVAAMAETLAHRGPDDNGCWESEDSRVLFGFRRLAFFDMSPAGHQPMHFDGLSLVFNGEVYNHQTIRKELKHLGHTFVSAADTETILHAWREWGSEAVHKFRGMFAFALHDEKNGKLHVYRDRFGVKPLYYYHKDGLFACASEIKALLKHPTIYKERAVDTDALSLFLQLAYIPAPWSIFKNIRKLEPAHCLTIYPDGRVDMAQYWDINEYYTNDASRTEEELIEELEQECTDAFSLRMLADRPVGMFLSGGIDSSVVAGILARNKYKNIETFTIGFGEKEYDEAEHARGVAEYLGTTHHEWRCTPEEAQAIIPQLPEIYDEPFADGSAIPTYLVSGFARKHVAASLSADGGDELFGGYRSYKSMMSFQRRVRWLSLPGAYALLCLAIGASRLGLIPLRYAHKFEKAKRMYPLRYELTRLFAELVSHFNFDEAKSLLKEKSLTSSGDVFAGHAPKRPIGAHRTLQHLDMQLYMADDILVKVDRATMAHSLEGREPLLDHKLAEFVAGIPESQLLDESTNKYLLREVLYKYVPKELVDRPKQGFGVPLDAWLKNELRHLLDTYLDKERIETEGIFNPAMVEKEKSEFLAGRQPYTRVWNIIMFEMWHERWMS